VAVNLAMPVGLRSVIAICTYPASRGAASIPVDLLGRFPAGDGFAYIGVLAIKKVERAPFVVDLVAFQVGLVNGQPSFGMLRFE
jgi:hypothetical protein